jgi:hypothetical protein
MRYNIKGKIIDSDSNSPLLGVTVSYNSNTVTTNKNGRFIIKGEVANGEIIILNISQLGYNPITTRPYKQDGSLKNNIRILKLTSNKTNLEIEKAKLSQLDNNLVKSISKPEGSSGFQQKALSGVINKIKSLLVPTVVTLISSFGVTNISKLIEDPTSNITPQCPNQEILQELINRRNKLAKQLNNLYKTVDTATQSLNFLEGIIANEKENFTTLKFIPIPTPPTPTPSLVPPIQDLKPILEKNIEKFSKINSGTLSILLVLKDNIEKILNLLSLLDNLIQQCSEDADLEEINEELLNINTEQTEGNPPQSSVSGFNFDIEIETTNNNLKRRRAVAKNNQGIILLRGEYSYSASDKILIDELIFFIQTENLKAD